MNLENKTLEDWLESPPQEAFKRGGDDFPFYSRYNTFKDYLSKNVHKEVTNQAIYKEFSNDKARDKVIWLNDHGPNHIKTVISRASEILSNGVDLNAREIFLLLNAIQVHDIGNFYGRYGHEKNILKAISEGLTPIVFDNTEIEYIKRIAQVHGGKVNYKDGSSNKNTISTIKQNVMSDGYPIRQQFLASVLRFADELADDKYRADIKSLREGNLPKGSEIYHAYASCLDTVKVDHSKQAIELHFKIPKEFATRTFGKLNKEDELESVFLIDEIYSRAIKMHDERIYCSKFWKKFIDLDFIWVQIEFYGTPASEDVLDEQDFNIHDDITFTLKDVGYPDTEHDIFKLCYKELAYSDGQKITGVNVSKKINKQK
jgi:hypothetical protein